MGAGVQGFDAVEAAAADNVSKYNVPFPNLGQCPIDTYQIHSGPIR